MKARDAAARESKKLADHIINRLLDGPLEHAGRKTVETLVYDALKDSGFYEAILAAHEERAFAQVARDEARQWKERASRADDRDTCEHCGSTDELTRSAVSCQPCLVRLLKGELSIK
jgi:hypothetical protein